MEPSFPSSTFWEFHRHVVDDPALFAQLQQVAETEDFIPLVVEVATARGYALGDGDVRAALHLARRMWLEKGLQ